MDVKPIKLKMPLEKEGNIFVYLVNSELLIDAGFCSAEQAEEIYNYAQVKDVLVTHHHIDHVGLLFYKPVRAYIHSIETKLLEIYTKTRNFSEFYLTKCREYGIPERYTSFLKFLSSMKLEMKAEIKAVGNLKNIFGLTAVHIPGHTPGHLCFYADGVLFSGDTVLTDTTPHISPYPYFPGNPVQDYLRSLQKLLKMDVDVIYPAHGEVIKDPKRKIRELIEHYLGRIEEVYNILDEKWLRVEDIAREVTWSIRRYDDLDDFNRFLAIGETIAYLKYLKKEKRAVEKEIDGVIHFKRR